jgi:hypothetical protein
MAVLAEFVREGVKSAIAAAKPADYVHNRNLYGPTHYPLKNHPYQEHAGNIRSMRRFCALEPLSNVSSLSGDCADHKLVICHTLRHNSEFRSMPSADRMHFQPFLWCI